MLITPQRPAQTPPALEFKSNTFFVPVLLLYTDDLSVIEQFLQEKIRQAPEFFKNSSLVFDVHALNKKNSNVDIVALTQLFRGLGLFPIGIRGGNEFQHEQAQELFISIDSGRSKDSEDSRDVFTETKEETVVSSAPEQPTIKTGELASVSPKVSTLITRPVRSGQRIYAEGDLIVLSQVSAGAEIMAEGNIHVYNTLRGRALAGVQGNGKARIFCSDLQAELVSIAGDYKTSEYLDKNIRKKPVQVFLQDRALIIEVIA
jgi:septum site-determining protein MinC